LRRYIGDNRQAVNSQSRKCLQVGLYSGATPGIGARNRHRYMKLLSAWHQLIYKEEWYGFVASGALRTQKTLAQPGVQTQGTAQQTPSDLFNTP
jgi:hypothetical protein